MKHNIIPNIVFIVVLLTITLLVFGLYLLFASQNHFAQIEPIIDGTGSRPYVYRVLTALITKSISSLFGFSYYVSAAIVMCLSLIGFSLAMIGFTKSFIQENYVKVVALIAPIGLIPFLIYQRHIYDFPTLFLTTLALFLLTQQALKTYIIVFFLACLTKETSLFLIIFFIFHFRNIERKRLILLSLIQILIYGVTRLAIVYQFRNNPGESIEYHLSDHISAYVQYPWLASFLFLAMVLVTINILRQKEDQTNFLKNVFITIGFPFLILYFISGMPFEIRVFFEIYPVIFMSIALTAINFITPHQSSMPGR